MTDHAKQFDLDDPDLPKAIKKAAMTSGGYPYEDHLDGTIYEESLRRLQVQLVRLQSDMLAKGRRMLLIFEGRDAAGKGGAIGTYRENLNPRYNIIVALPKPSSREATQWYFQRYVEWLPAAGETVLFDRSYYNRAGVEQVMGFATPQQVTEFLEEVPKIEQMLVRDGLHLFKFYIDIGREMQMKRFHDRRHDPLKQWKITDIDRNALKLWDEYSAARDRMLAATHIKEAPWTVIRGNDKRRARLAVMQTVLQALDYEGKEETQIGAFDDRIVYDAPRFLEHHRG